MRGFNPTAAQKQFGDTEAWRKKNDVDRVFAEFDTDEFEDAKRFYPRWTGRRDKVCIYPPLPRPNSFEV